MTLLAIVIQCVVHESLLLACCVHNSTCQLSTEISNTSTLDD